MGALAILNHPGLFQQRITGTRMQKDTEHSRNLMHCESCGSEVPGYDIVNCGSIEHGYRELCNQCFNAEVASAQGLESFENLRFDSYRDDRLRRRGARVPFSDASAWCGGRRGRIRGQARTTGPDISSRSWTTLKLNWSRCWDG
jgi:hypothetical protein